MDQNRLALLALHFIPGIGNFLIKQLVSYCGSAERAFQLPKNKLLKIPNVGESTYSAILSGDPFRAAENELLKAEKNKIELVFYLDSQYPQRLKSLDDCPTLLYTKGNLNLNADKTIGIVGTRKATNYGKEVVEQLMEEITHHQPLIVSGLAYGIDIHAHKLAIQHKISTVGIMGSGLDIIYPAVHKDTARKMLEDGGLVTENPLGCKPDAHNFPARNRIIAGMSDALIVVEAAEKGGALITAEIANSYNKDVFAVPGRLNNEFSKGCNKLIKTNKAHLLTCGKDIEYIMNWSIEKERSPGAMQQLDLNLFEGEEKMVVNLLKENHSPLMIDELCRKTAIPPGSLASILLNLEFKNVVRSLPGKMYKLNRN